VSIQLEGVRALREVRGWTQGDLAAHAGVRESVVARSEAGGFIRHKPARKIAAALDVSVDTLAVVWGIDRLAAEVSGELDPGGDEFDLGGLAAIISDALDPQEGDGPRGDQ